MQYKNANMPDGASLLPESFRDLEPFARTWALPTPAARSEQRDRSSMAEMTALHDAMLSRIEDIFAYLDQHQLTALPDDAKRLLYLALSLAEVTPSVYFYKEERPAHAIDPRRIQFWPVPNMTPSG
jgi:hypothetical protein